MAAFLLWIIAFILCWPLAVLALVIYPFVWLLLLPFRVVGIAVDGILGLLSALFLLPVRKAKPLTSTKSCREHYRRSGLQA